MTTRSLAPLLALLLLAACTSPSAPPPVSPPEGSIEGYWIAPSGDAFMHLQQTGSAVTGTYYVIEGGTAQACGVLSGTHTGQAVEIVIDMDRQNCPSLETPSGYGFLGDILGSILGRGRLTITAQLDGDRLTGVVTFVGYFQVDGEEKELTRDSALAVWGRVDSPPAPLEGS